MTDEIERRLDDARACLAKASNTYDMSAIFSAITDIYAAVRLIAARPAPAGGAGEALPAGWKATKWRHEVGLIELRSEGFWAWKYDAEDTVWQIGRFGTFKEAARAIEETVLKRPREDAARAADAARGEKPDV